MVFISYCSANVDLAYKIVDFLEKKRIQCFIAPRNIPTGHNYASDLTNALRNCDAAVLVASAQINDSEHMLNEVDILVNHKKTIMPFFIEDFELNDEYRYYLGRAQRIIAYPDSVESYFPKIFDSLRTILNIEPEITVEPIETPETPSEKTKVFTYIPARGIMINPEDRQRNVSFRTDTFVNMFSGIYGEFLKLTDVETINKIFHTSGYTSGKAFAERLNSQWDQAQTPLSLEEKLRRWCEFDSEVGWGKFNVDVVVDETNDTFSGKLTINECFIVDMQRRHNICEFIKGYCEGVIETLLTVKVNLTCTRCPMTSRFGRACCFDINICD